MKHTILLTICLCSALPTLLFSQATLMASCKYKQLTFYAEKGEGLTQSGNVYTIYLVKDSLRQSIDTIGKYGGVLENELCVCTDTSVAFYENNALRIRSIKHYYFNNHKWNLSSPSLPAGDLDYVGVIMTDKKYKSYQHRLITPEKAVSDMTIKIGVGKAGTAVADSLSLIGSYEVEFMLSPDKKKYVVSKETLKEK